MCYCELNSGIVWRSLFTLESSCGWKNKMADIKVDRCYPKELLEKNLEAAVTGMYVVDVTFAYILPSHFIRL